MPSRVLNFPRLSRANALQGVRMDIPRSTAAAIFSITDLSPEAARRLRLALREMMPPNGKLVRTMGSTFVVLMRNARYRDADAFAKAVQALLEVLLPGSAVVVTTALLRRHERRRRLQL